MLWVTLLIACSKTEQPAFDDVPEVETETGAGAGAGEISAVSGLVNVLRFTVDVDAARSVELVCEGGGEVHAASSPEGTHHELRLLGLLAETTYACAADGESFSTTTGEFPYWIPEMVQSGDPAAADGYTLFNHVAHGSAAEEQKLIIVDPQGRVRWYYEMPAKYTGDLDATWLGDDRILYGGGYGARPTVITLEGEEVWQGPESAGGVHHHHAEPWGDGGVMTLATQLTTRIEPSDDEDDVFDGFLVEIIDADGAPVWSYSSANLLVDLPPSHSDDPYHANWVGEIDGDYWVSLRNAKAIVAVDADGGFLWEMGPYSDFELRYPDGTAAPASEWFFGQHAPEVDLPRMLVYDNGYDREGGEEYSRVVEYEVDLDARVVTVLWSWTESPWYELIWGDVDRLDSGRVLITRAHCHNCSTDLEGEYSALIEVDPATDEVVWRLEFVGNTDGLYRAERFGLCEAFNNRTLCP